MATKQSMGLLAWSGREPWPPVPWMVMSKATPVAITGPGAQAHPAGFEVGVEVGAPAGVGGDALLLHIGQQGEQVAAALLAPLKEQDHPAVDRLPVLGEDLCRAEEHRRVAVVPAGVHSRRRSR